MESGRDNFQLKWIERKTVDGRKLLEFPCQENCQW